MGEFDGVRQEINPYPHEQPRVGITVRQRIDYDMDLPAFLLFGKRRERFTDSAS